MTPKRSFFNHVTRIKKFNLVDSNFLFLAALPRNLLHRTSGGLPGRADTVFIAAEAWTWLCRSFSKVQREKVKRLLVNELATGLHLFLMKKNSRPDACHFFLDHVYLEVCRSLVKIPPFVDYPPILECVKIVFDKSFRSIDNRYKSINMEIFFPFWKYKWIVWYWIRYL